MGFEETSAPKSLDAVAISWAKMERWRFLWASALPLSCLILDQRLWPESCSVVVEKERHVVVNGVGDGRASERSTAMPRLGAMVVVMVGKLV